MQITGHIDIVRINNTDIPEENVSEDCMQKVQDILNELDCGVGIDLIDRVHRIGPRKVSNVDRKLYQHVIVRFSSFKDQTKVYRSRKKAKKVKFRLDLMRNRLSTLKTGM